MRIAFVSRSDDLSAIGAPPAVLHNLQPVAMPVDLHPYYGQALALAHTPGAQLWATLPQSPCRGMIHAPGAGSNRIFAIGGDRLYSITSAGVATDIGTVAGTDRADMAAVRGDIVFAAGGLGYFATAGERTQIADVDLGSPSSVASLGLRAIFSVSDTDFFRWSQPLQPGNIDALDFAAGERLSDRLVAIRAQSTRLVLLQDRSTDFYAQTTDADAAFQAIPESANNVGCYARDTAKALGETLMWMTDGLEIAQMRGFQVRIVSPPGIARILAANPSPASNAIAYTLSRDGRGAYVLTLPGVATWAYLDDTNTWINRGWRTTASYPFGWSARVANRDFIARVDSGEIYETSSQIHTDGGQPIERIAYAVAPVEVATRLRSLRVEGRAVQVPGGVTPHAFVSMSGDNGQTWTAERPAPISPPGAVRDRVWNWGLVRPPGVVFRVRAVTNYGLTLYGLSLNEANGAAPSVG